MARALSDRTTGGTAVTAGPQAGFDIDIGALHAGNTIRLTYTDNVTSKQRTLTLVRVDDPAALPLPNTATTDPNDKVIGLDFAGGIAAVASQLNGRARRRRPAILQPGGLDAADPRRRRDPTRST